MRLVDLADYDYFLPQKNLALKPASPRDSSKLFIYDTKTDEIVFDRFYNLNKHLPKNSFLILNNTKVLPARVVMKKKSGGKVAVLFLVNDLKNGHLIKVMVDRKINLGEKIYFNEKEFLRVIDQEKNIFTGKFEFSIKRFYFLLEKYGTMPIPLYLKKTPLKKDELMKKYQTIFAQKEGSAAAPTASLHFTNRVFEKLEKEGIKKYFITLHVGLGTFAPITDENIKFKKLHEEYYEIEGNVWKKIIKEKNKGKKLVAVGTTVVRTLESIANKIQNKNLKMRIKNSKFFEKTDLFILPPYDFKMVDILITNFHLPKSSLMMLVEAFLQYKKAKKHLVDLYNIAIENNFRFYSFGDSMLII
ncbi:MAG: tRNA preQ1(34) S-adenosylmethionine ribosyltransferase-isomerase QueA [Patescibacteria group bacterium]|nr:tRNA preQ1(34) S-adenosylmethionine ribosyltransferase-isomerase QueA [Patescibacteria group bacterium]